MRHINKFTNLAKNFKTMTQQTEPVTIPFPTLSPAHAERIHALATEMPYKYGVELIEMIKNAGLEQYKESQKQESVENPA